MNSDKNEPKSGTSKFEPAEPARKVWDTHNVIDLSEEACERSTGRGTRVMIEPDVYARIEEEARRRGVSPEALIQVWLVERLERGD